MFVRRYYVARTPVVVGLLNGYYRETLAELFIRRKVFTFILAFTLVWPRGERVMQLCLPNMRTTGAARFAYVFRSPFVELNPQHRPSRRFNGNLN